VSAMILQKNNSGFSLVEVMMAILILMVGMVGLLQSINIALDVNLRNQFREEAVNIGQRVMNDMRGKGFDNISAAYPTINVPSKVRTAFKPYSVSRRSIVLSSETKQLEVLVKWKYKGVGYENRVISPISILR